VLRRSGPICALASIYVASALVFSLLGHAHQFPNLFPDEMFYGKLSQAVAAGDGLEWRGSGWGLPPLWPVVLSLAWHFGSLAEGYGIAKVVGALIAPLCAFPLWFLGREIVGPRLALLPVLLCMLGAWMTVTSYLVSENLAFPLATACLTCTVASLRDTRTRWIAGSAGFAVLAALARTQMLALGVIVLLALVLDVVRQPAGERRVRAMARPPVVWGGLALVVAAGLSAFVAKPDLTNYDVLAHHVSVSEVASTTGKHAASSIVMFGFVPVVAALALMMRPANWRDDRVGPLVVTIAATAVVLFSLLGRFEAWATSGSPVERYAMYLAPLLLVALVAAPGRVTRTAALLSAAIVVVALCAAPITRNYIEQPALYGMQKRLYELGPFARDHLRVSLVLAAIPIAGAGAVALSARRFASVGLSIAVVLTGALMVMQTWAAQHAEIALERSARPQVLPPRLDWVDRAANGPVAMLAIGKAQPLRGSSDLYTDFFNRGVVGLFSTMPSGSGECLVHVEASGVLTLRKPRCAPWVREYVLLAGPWRATFYGQRQVAATQHNGTLISLPRGAPRIFAVVRPPCTDEGCSGALELELHLDEPGLLTATFTPGQRRHRIRVYGRTRRMSTDGPTRVQLRAKPGDRRLELPVDWTASDGPELQSVYVTSAGKTTRIF
jgi:hypothetical protein